jgi:hypothetical protein
MATLDAPTAATVYDTFEDDVSGELPGMLVDACDRYSELFRYIHIERKLGRKQYRRTGKWLRRHSTDQAIDHERLADDVWMLCRRHADAHGSYTYRILFYGDDDSLLGDLVLSVPGDLTEETPPSDVSRESELVGVLQTITAAYKEQASLYLDALNVCNQLVEKQTAAMGFLAEVKMVEAHFQSKREEREADLLEATEDARAQQKKWEALSSFGVSIGSKIGERLAEKMGDWTTPSTVPGTTAFGRLWSRFRARDDLLRLFSDPIRGLWDAMVRAANEDDWLAAATAFRIAASQEKDLLPDVVAVIVATAETDLPGWSVLAKRAAWVTDTK